MGTWVGVAMPSRSRGRLNAEVVKERLQQLEPGRTVVGGRWGEPWCGGGRSQWGPGEPAPVPATPAPAPAHCRRPRPFPKGGGALCRGQGGAQAFRAKGLTDPHRSVKTEKHVLLEI